MNSASTNLTTFLKWSDSADEICRRVAAQKTKAKVILKTRNEDSLLLEWIEHHIPIFGSEGIIIFDNMSDNSSTYAVYEKFRDMIQVFQFDEMHNHIHDALIFRELYQAVRETCLYYLFLDTDEFLYWLDSDGHIIADERVVKNVVKSGERVVPGIWVENAPGDRNSLLWTFRQNRIMGGIKGGKPMISSDTIIGGFGNHNVQLDPEMLATCQTANLMIMHLKNFSASQRIKANLQKLRSYNSSTQELEVLGLVGRDFLVEDILSIDESALASGNAKNYIQEIKALSSSESTIPGSGSIKGTASIKDGRLVFTDPEDEFTMREFISNPSIVLARAFSRCPDT